MCLHTRNSFAFFVDWWSRCCGVRANWTLLHRFSFGFCFGCHWLHVGNLLVPCYMAQTRTPSFRSSDKEQDGEKEIQLRKRRAKNSSSSVQLQQSCCVCAMWINCHRHKKHDDPCKMFNSNIGPSAMEPMNAKHSFNHKKVHENWWTTKSCWLISRLHNFSFDSQKHTKHSNGRLVQRFYNIRQTHECFNHIDIGRSLDVSTLNTWW